MTNVPQTNIGPFFFGKDVEIKTTPTFQSGAPYADISGMSLSSSVRKGATTVTGTTTKAGSVVTMIFSGLAVGRWSGVLEYPGDVMATFEFDVLAI